MTDATVIERTEWPLIERVRVLNLAPGDQIVLEAPGDCSAEEVGCIKDAWRAAFPDQRYPIILTSGLTVAAVLRILDERDGG